MENVSEFLVESASNVASAAFKFLQHKELTENEAKEYCAKNMMLNLHSICSQVSTQLKKNELFNEAIAKKFEAEEKGRDKKEED